MLIEMTEEQQKQLLILLANSQIRGSDAPLIMNLSQTLQTPVKRSEKLEEPEKK